jgi:hypothetical protein
LREYYQELNPIARLLVRHLAGNTGQGGDEVGDLPSPGCPYEYEEILGCANLLEQEGWITEVAPNRWHAEHLTAKRGQKIRYLRRELLFW